KEQKLYLPLETEGLVSHLEKAGIGIEMAAMAGDQLTVTADQEELAAVDKLLAMYAKQAMIYLTAKFVETTERIESASLLSDGECQTLIRRMSAHKGTDLLSAPSLVMRPGQRGKIEVVREFIFPNEYDKIRPATGEAGAGGEGEFLFSPSNPTAFEVENVGVTLDFEKAAIRPDGMVTLRLRSEVAEFDGFWNYSHPAVEIRERKLGKPQVVVVTENRVEGPIFAHQMGEMELTIGDGETVCFGGWVKERRMTVEDKVPVLGDVPVVGVGFRREEEVEGRRFLYAMVTARLITDAGHAFQEDPLEE
ncbi:MAG: hypothetical protein AAF191_16520, partial [Verrucomicrobiota bacterium]